jgi:hypothetical protein
MIVAMSCNLSATEPAMRDGVAVPSAHGRLKGERDLTRNVYLWNPTVASIPQRAADLSAPPTEKQERFSVRRFQDKPRLNPCPEQLQ